MQKMLSVLTKEEMQSWWRSIWTDIKGASTRGGHPAPFPAELAERLIRMFSFAGDTILDPFAGTGSTAIAAIAAGRNSISNEIEDSYLDLAYARLVSAGAKSKSIGATIATIELHQRPRRMKRIGGEIVVPVVGSFS
jgi:site-specific DNA-methyltransferase (adenine-specific)